MQKILAVLAVLLLLSGCGPLRKFTLSSSESDVKNAITSRQVAKNLLSTWSLNSGFIRASLGTNIKKLPVEVVEAMDDLDKLAAKTDPYTDFELGTSEGLRVRIALRLVQEAINKYMPDILKYIPSPLLF